MDERNRRRRSFDEVAELYDEVRPGYPDPAFDDLVDLVPSREPRVLEIGAGTGQATLPLARRASAMVCIEPGPSLAEVLRRKLTDRVHVEVIVQTFEEWKPAGKFELVVCAGAWHWVDPQAGYPKAAAVLLAGGVLALMSNEILGSDADRGFHYAVQDVYARVAPELLHAGAVAASYEELPDRSEEMRRSGLFERVLVRRYPNRQTYSTERYLKLLQTHSPHRSLAEATRSALLTGIGELVDARFGGTVIEDRVTVVSIGVTG